MTFSSFWPFLTFTCLSKTLRILIYHFKKLLISTIEFWVFLLNTPHHSLIPLPHPPDLVRWQLFYYCVAMIMTRLNPVIVKFLLTRFLPLLFPIYLSVIQLSTLQMNQIFPRNTKIQDFLNSVLETSLSGTLSPASTQTTILQALNRKAILGLPTAIILGIPFASAWGRAENSSTEHTSLQ